MTKNWRRIINQLKFIPQILSEILSCGDQGLISIIYKPPASIKEWNLEGIEELTASLLLPPQSGDYGLKDWKNVA